MARLGSKSSRPETAWGVPGALGSDPALASSDEVAHGSINQDATAGPAVQLRDTTHSDAAVQYRQAASLMDSVASGHIDLSHYPLLSDIPPIISQCRALTSLNLAGTAVRELEALASLPRLERLVLWGTSVRDLGPLSQIRSLRWLNIGFTNVESLDPLIALPHLEFLDASYTPIASIDPLATSIRMRELILRGTGVSCIKPAAGLRDLMLLDLAGTLVTDLSPVRNLKALTWLNTGAV